MIWPQRNEALTPASVWMNLVGTMRRKASPTRKATWRTIPFSDASGMRGLGTRCRRRLHNAVSLLNATGVLTLKWSVVNIMLYEFYLHQKSGWEDPIKRGDLREDLSQPSSGQGCTYSSRSHCPPRRVLPVTQLLFPQQCHPWVVVLLPHFPDEETRLRKGRRLAQGHTDPSPGPRFWSSSFCVPSTR